MREFLLGEHLLQLNLSFWTDSKSQNHSEERGWLEPNQDVAITFGVRLACVQRPDDTPFLLVLPVWMLCKDSPFHVRRIPFQQGRRLVINLHRSSKWATTESEARLRCPF